MRKRGSVETTSRGVCVINIRTLRSGVPGNGHAPFWSSGRRSDPPIDCKPSSRWQPTGVSHRAGALVEPHSLSASRQTCRAVRRGSGRRPSTHGRLVPQSADPHIRRLSMSDAALYHIIRWSVGTSTRSRGVPVFLAQAVPAGLSWCEQVQPAGLRWVLSIPTELSSTQCV